MKNSNETNWDQLKKMDDSDIDYSDIPEIDPVLWEDAKIVYTHQKVMIKIKVDEDLALWLKHMGRDSESAVNNLLRSYFIGLKSLQSHHNSEI